MIKKVPGIYAFVLKDTELDELQSTTTLSQGYCKTLPIFDLNLLYSSQMTSSSGMYYVILNHGFEDNTVSYTTPSSFNVQLNPKYVDIINQTWDQILDDGY